MAGPASWRRGETPLILILAIPMAALAQPVWLARDAPSSYSRHPMVHDPSRGRLLFLAGEWARTWEWDGRDWTLRPTLSAPSPRHSEALAYLARGRMVLFGGYDLGRGVPLGDTWEWDGADWVRRFPSMAPPARSGALFYDPTRRRVLLFGRGGGESLGDMWEWDGTEWRPSFQRRAQGLARNTPSPTIRAGAARSSSAARVPRAGVGRPGNGTAPPGRGGLLPTHRARASTFSPSIPTAAVACSRGDRRKGASRPGSGTEASGPSASRSTLSLGQLPIHGP